MNTIRNWVIISVIVLCTLLLCIYLGGIILTIVLDSIDHVQTRFITNVNIVWFYINYLWQYRNSLTLEYSNYFVVKVVASTLAPFITIGGACYSYRDKVGKWKPYKDKESIHGDAKWASEEDIKRAGLRSKQGMLLGKDKSGYFIASGYQHALLFAPTGSGKGVGFVIPNLLFWNDSIIVHDIKLENYTLTSGWRAKMGQKVFVWAPADPDGKTHCYNPIDWVSSKPGQMVDDVQKNC